MTYDEKVIKLMRTFIQKIHTVHEHNRLKVIDDSHAMELVRHHITEFNGQMKLIEEVEK